MTKGIQKENMEIATQLQYRFDVAGTGLTVLDRIYTDGDLADEALGGSCGNVLLSLAMLHRNVVPVITIGDDDEGRRLVAEFVEAGAIVDHIYRKAGVRSPIIAQDVDTASSMALCARSSSSATSIQLSLASSSNSSRSIRPPAAR